MRFKAMIRDALIEGISVNGEKKRFKDWILG